MAIDSGSSPTTRLLTLLNVSATKAGKRKRTFEDSKPTEKLNKRRAVQFAAAGEDNDASSAEQCIESQEQETSVETATERDEEDLEDGPQDKTDPYEEHFGAKSMLCTETAREAVARRAWSASRRRCGKLGNVVESLPVGSESSDGLTEPHLSEKLKTALKARQTKLPRGI
ncbi:hypothetical protein A0H81_09177 [Grifola frondosa]|uniref:Uncharacterized protein n=1 Tax=Grifola frondosa TaxID=5627 RepID=A0A1C7M1L8_GRIFR|nr:hypothetical protein A0H81_09177 [Grifola frondosa]